MIEKIDSINNYYMELGERLSDPNIISDQAVYTKLMREYKNLQPIIEKFNKYRAHEKDYTESAELLTQDLDNDFKALEEACGKSISELMTDFRIALFLNKPSGKYGFNSKEGFDGIAALTSYNYERYLEASAGFVIKAPTDRPFELPEKYGPDIRFYGINP